MRLLKKNVLLRILNSYLVDSPQPTNISYLWNFGSLLAICLIIQILTGAFLAMHYTPNVDFAFNSVEHIMRDVNNGWLIRYTHANVASFFFIFVYAHIGRGLYYGSYLSPRVLVWSIGVIILVLMMAFVLNIWPNCDIDFSTLLTRYTRLLSVQLFYTYIFNTFLNMFLDVQLFNTFLNCAIELSAQFTIRFLDVQLFNYFVFSAFEFSAQITSYIRLIYLNLFNYFVFSAFDLFSLISSCSYLEIIDRSDLVLESFTAGIITHQRTFCSYSVVHMEKKGESSTPPIDSSTPPIDSSIPPIYSSIPPIDKKKRVCWFREVARVK